MMMNNNDGLLGEEVKRGCGVDDTRWVCGREGDTSMRKRKCVL